MPFESERLELIVEWLGVFNSVHDYIRLRHQ